MAKAQGQNFLKVGRSGRRIQEFKQFRVHDDACGMKVGTDALLLGSWAGTTSLEAGQSVKHILDIGTGSGVLALMLAQRFPQAEIDAVELEHEAAQQARENAAHSPFGERIQVHQRAIQGWSKKADLIVCNPPFFHDHPKSQDRKRNLARHDDTLPLRVLFSTSSACLHGQGSFDLVFPEDRAQEVKEEAQRHGFILHAKVQLRATPDHEVIRSLWSWRKAETSVMISETWDLESEEGQGEWSEAVASRLAPFVG